ncbi:MAG: hypothetical protein RLY31_2212 [Bacteroidota bacterium]|jgi:hypothetical protein
MESEADNNRRARRIWLDRTWLALLLLTPVALWMLPPDFFDESSVIICPSRLFFHIECLGCGMTRAVMHMHHLEVEDALYYNYGVVVVFPALVVIWGVWVRNAYRRIAAERQDGIAS